MAEVPKTPQVYIPSRTGIVSVYVSVFHNVSSVGLQESISSDFIIDQLNLQVNRYNVCYNPRIITGEVWQRHIIAGDLNIFDQRILKSVIIKTTNFLFYEIIFVGPEPKDIPTVNEIFRGNFVVIELTSDFNPDPEIFKFEGRIIKNISEHIIWTE